MGRFFPFANKEEIIANFRQSDSASYNDHFTYPQGGAIEYIHSLKQRVPDDRLLLGERVMRIDLDAKRVITDKRELTYDRLISTIPFPQLLQLCGVEYDASLYSWNKVLVFNLGFDSKGADTRNNWVYFPSKELSFYRIGYYDNIFGSDRMSLYVELGFDKDAPIDVAYWFERVLADLRSAGIITTQQLVSHHSVVMDPAYVHINEQCTADVQAKKALLAQSGIYSIGRYGSWTYCSIEDGMCEARATAEL